VSHLINGPVYGSACESCKVHRVLVGFARLASLVRVLPIPAHLRYRVGVVGRVSGGGRGGRVLPASVWCAQGFSCFVKGFPTAERRGRRSRHPCRALSMGRGRQVMTVCETAAWAHRSSGCSVAHLVSLHRSYSHRTPREGVRSPSG
jgi:hypothetical protein